MTKKQISSIIARECRKLLADKPNITHAGFPLVLYGRLSHAVPDIGDHLRRHHPTFADPYQAAKLYTPEDVIEDLDSRGGTFS